MNKCYQYTGQLCSPLYPKTLFRSTPDEVIVNTPDDFLSMFRLTGAKSNSVYLTPRDNYRMLENLITLAKESMPMINYFLCALQMPGTCRLPNRLLEEDVFLVVDLTSDREALLAEGHCVFCIENDLVRDLVEAGNNQLHLTLYKKGDHLQEWQAFTRQINALGFDEVVI